MSDLTYNKINNIIISLNDIVFIDNATDQWTKQQIIIKCNMLLKLLKENVDLKMLFKIIEKTQIEADELIFKWMKLTKTRINQILSQSNCYMYSLNETTNRIEHNIECLSHSTHRIMELLKITTELRSNAIKYEVNEHENIDIINTP